jgi:drug/metabolite transporter (DMT)-like permease
MAPISLRLSPRLRADLVLLLVAAIWGSGFVAQRLGAQVMDPLYFNASRFLAAGLLLMLLDRLRRRLQPWYAALRGHWQPTLLAGLLLFGGSLLQQSAIAYTTVGNTAFITGLYVVLVPLELWIGWRQRPAWLTWAAVGLAALGIALLSLTESFQARPGDLLALLGAVLWAGHVIITGRMANRLDGFAFAIGQFLVCAGLSWALGLASNPAGALNVMPAWPAVLYSAAFPSAAAFTLQIFGQRHAPPTDAAIVLSMETVFGAFFGFLFFQELFTLRQLLGAGLILAAIVLCQVKAESH